MAWTWGLDGEAQATQIVPAKLGQSRLASLLSNPGGNFGPGPQPAIGSGTSQQSRQGLLLEGREARGFAGIGGPAVLKAGGTLLVIAMDEVTEPVRAEANEGSGVFGRAAGGNQPQGVPAARSSWVGRRVVGGMRFVGSEMGVERYHT